MQEPSITEWKKVVSRWKNKEFTAHKYFDELKAAPSMRKVYPISGEEVQKYTSFGSPAKDRADKDIIAALEELGLENIDLDANTGYLVGDKNPRKLGKVLNKAGFKDFGAKLKKRNNNSNPTGNFAIVISAHPYDILRASYKRSWNSCLDPESRHYFQDVLGAVLNKEKAEMIAYLVKEGDEKIHKPLGRTFIHPYQYHSRANQSNNNRVSVNYELYDHDCSVWHDLPKEEVKDTPPSSHIWDTSCGFYGKFPQFFRHELTNIVNNEINKDHPHISADKKITNGWAEFSGGYTDNNDWDIRKLRAYNKPPEKVASTLKKAVKVCKSNPSIDAVIATNCKSRRWEYGWGFSFSARHAYEILNGTVNRNMIDRFKRSTFKFYQVRDILKKRPEILNRKYIRDYISDRGAEYAKLVENYKLG